MIVMSLIPIYRFVSHTHDIRGKNEDIYIGAKLASQYLLGSFYINNEGGYRYLSRNNKEMILTFDKNRLIKKEGYEILIHNIQSCHFVIQNDMLYMDVVRNKEQYHFLIGYVREKENTNE